MSTRRWKLIVFGDGSLRWRNAARRLAKEAGGSPSPLDVEVYDLKRLATTFPGFMRKHEVLIENATRGMGYWIWKPFLIREALRATNADGVICLDAGSTLNFGTSRSERRWLDYQDIAQSTGGLFFQMHLKEERYTKPELLDYLDVSEEHRTSGQLEGGHVFFANQSAALDLVDDWYQTACANRYQFLDDSRWRPSDGKLTVHRHDQSILSCLVKTAQFGMAIPEETYFEPDWTLSGAGFPIWGTRQRSGRSVLKPKRTIRGHDVGTPSEFLAACATAIGRRLKPTISEPAAESHPPWRQ